MTSCLVKPALYIVQKTGPRVKLADHAAIDEAEDEESDTGEFLLDTLKVYHIYGTSCS